ncbi:hypothetical protein FRX31_005909 [Thalictrum thalictroides]|uniref:Uncharacterized protein n=1 Tax=Thalictrum thalictroides TaxID=46969 RepID=A0A7J6X3X8_THATH|nr:hypothetical protein FRX31_005909 [Thalictrum thalictroides]
MGVALCSEPNALWRKLIQSKYGTGDQDWWPRKVRSAHGVGFCKGVMTVADEVFKGIECNLGDGRNIRFWKDIWCQEHALAERFPRLYMLSVLKHGVVAEFWELNGNVFSWNFNFH